MLGFKNVDRGLFSRIVYPAPKRKENVGCNLSLTIGYPTGVSCKSNIVMARIQTAEITFENVTICCSSKRASLE